MKMMAAMPFRVRLADGDLRDWCKVPDGYTSHSHGLHMIVTRTPRGQGEEVCTFIENLRNEPSPLIVGVSFFRGTLEIPAEDVPVVHHGGGGVTDAVFPSKAWRIERSELVDWAKLTLEGARGRSSNRDLPIFIVTDFADTHGVAFVAGYSGHVVNALLRESDYCSIEVEGSVQGLQLQLGPHETLRLGSMLIIPYTGDIAVGRNLLRRTLRDEICPPAPEGIVRPAVTYVHWFGIQDSYNAESLEREAELQASLGTEIFELDAAWALQGTHKHYGAGNWAREDSAKFPDGIRVFADRIRALGMRFGLWFEPETVEEGTAIHQEHPEWLIPKPAAYRYLLDFGQKAVVDYMIDLVGGLVQAYGVEWIRMDSNLDMNEYWATIADPGTRGACELRHWQGWYRFLDALLARFPRLHVEGCSSGGRRIDLEMLKRSHSFWISDNTNFEATVHQHIGGANHWLPSHLLNMEAVKYPLFPQKIRPYDKVGDETFSDYWLLTLCGGLFGLGGPHTAYPDAINEKFRRFIARYKALRHLLAADFYPLLPQPRSVADWDAWQFHDPGTGNGMIMVFRHRGQASTMHIQPRNLGSCRPYQLDSFPEALQVDLQNDRMVIKVTLPDANTAGVIAYTVAT